MMLGLLDMDMQGKKHVAASAAKAAEIYCCETKPYSRVVGNAVVTTILTAITPGPCIIPCRQHQRCCYL